MITITFSTTSLVKNLMIKGASESPDLYLWDKPKNAKNGAKFINLQSDYCYIPCYIIDQKPEIELQDEYWSYQHDQRCP